MTAAHVTLLSERLFRVSPAWQARRPRVSRHRHCAGWASRPAWHRPTQRRSHPIAL